MGTAGTMADKRRHPKVDDAGANYVPTPEQIAASCAEIQATWDERQECERRRWAVEPARDVQVIAAPDWFT